MLERVAATIGRHRMMGPGSRVIAAVSGGPDSVCLLYLLRELKPRIGFEIAGVAHFNHKLRGEASDGDERFVADLADRLGIPFHRASAPPPERGNLEDAGRQARRKFFLELLRDLGAACVAVGHTRDDQAETVLFRLLRGAGLAGLAGILPVTGDGIARPLLNVTRREVEAYLRARGIGWREDATNREFRFARNRIRHQLLPQLSRDWNPRTAEILANLADLAYEEERWWAGEIGRHRSGVVAGTGPVELHADELAALPRALARRVVREAIRQARGDLKRVEFRHVEQILDLAYREQGRGRVSLPGLHAVRSFDWVRLGEATRTGAAPATLLKIPGQYPAPDGNSLIVLELTKLVRGADGYATLREDLCWRKLPAPLELRGWRPGDQYRPVGHTRDQKLRDLFQRARVPSWRRASWPILSSEDKILWTRDFGVAAEFAAGRGSGWRLRVREIPTRG